MLLEWVEIVDQSFFRLKDFAKDIHLHKHDRSYIWSYDKCFYQRYSNNAPY